LYKKSFYKKLFEYFVEVKNIMLYKVTAVIINKVNLTQKLGSI